MAGGGRLVMTGGGWLLILDGSGRDWLAIYTGAGAWLLITVGGGRDIIVSGGGWLVITAWVCAG